MELRRRSYLTGQRWDQAASEPIKKCVIELFVGG
jgi:hypothetical protein